MKTKEDTQPWANSQKVVLVIVAFLAYAIGFWDRAADEHSMPFGAGHKEASHGPEGVPHEAAENRIYVCPMSDIPPMPQPGKCPICGMALERRAKDILSRLR